MVEMARDDDFIIKILMNSISSSNNNNKTTTTTTTTTTTSSSTTTPSLLSTVLFPLFGFDGGGVVKVSDGAHSKYSGRCLNLVYANFVKAVFASDGSRNSTMPVNKTYQC
jgi:hypothetical protein